MPEIDVNNFGFGGSIEESPVNINDQDSNVVTTPQGEVTKLDKEPENKVEETKAEEVVSEKNDSKADDSNDNSEEVSYEEGTEITIGNNVYKINAEGNLVDENNVVFKTKEELGDFIKQFSVEQEEPQPSSYNLQSIQSLLDTNIVDNEGKAVEFADTEEGIKEYVNAVLQVKTDEAAVAGVNALFENYPILKDFLNYYVANGNSIEGFNEIKDRSNIVLDESNEAQQEAIIREAYKEFNRGGDVETYIRYLKDTKQLATVAKTELEALQAADSNIKAENERLAAEAQKQAQEQEIAYWQAVKQTIDSKVIGGYKIPDTVIINREGKQVAVTPDDFFNYLYQVDDKGNSRYMYDLAKQNPQDRFNDEILRAWLTYTGKGYNSLIDMAVADKQVQKLKLVANKNKSKQTISIKKPTINKSNKVDVGNFGY